MKSRAKPAVLIGYSNVQKGFILYDMTNNMFFVRDVLFKERIFSFIKQKQEATMFQPVDMILEDHGEYTHL